MKSLSYLSLVLLLLSLALPSTAAVYRCKDGKGGVVFQQNACAENRVFSKNADAYQLWKRLNALSQQAQQSLMKLQADGDSIAACEVNMRVYHQYLSSEEPAAENLSHHYPQLLRAYKALDECGQCKSSAQSSCLQAEQYLDKALRKLTEY